MATHAQAAQRGQQVLDFPLVVHFGFVVHGACFRVVVAQVLQPNSVNAGKGNAPHIHTHMKEKRATSDGTATTR